VLRELGQWPEALVTMREAVALLRRQHAPADLCPALDTLAWVLARSNQEPAAEAMYREEIAVETQGDEALRAQRMNAYYGLAVLAGDFGRYTEAAEFGKQAFDLARAALPAEHPHLLNIETAYANTLDTLHQNAAAETLFRQVIAAQTRQIGAEHKHTLMTKLALVANLVDQHREAEAAELALPTARSFESVLGADNAYTLSAWHFFGVAACASHQEDPGLSALERVAAARQRIYPPGTWVIDSSRLGIGECQLHLRRYAQAESTLLTAVAGLEKSRGAAFNRTEDGYRALRDLYIALGRKDEATRWSDKLPH
jgi:tetratricopeptide (TPR) repeat protein